MLQHLNNNMQYTNDFVEEKIDKDVAEKLYGDDYMTPVRMNEYEVSAHKVIRES